MRSTRLTTAALGAVTALTVLATPAAAEVLIPVTGGEGLAIVLAADAPGTNPQCSAVATVPERKVNSPEWPHPSAHRSYSSARCAAPISFVEVWGVVQYSPYETFSSGVSHVPGTDVYANGDQVATREIRALDSSLPSSAGYLRTRTVGRFYYIHDVTSNMIQTSSCTKTGPKTIVCVVWSAPVPIR